MSTKSDFDSMQPRRAAADPPRRFVRKFAVGIAGVAVILVGIPMIPLIGPGWLIVFTGLAILATEFPWAGRLRDRIHSRMRSLLGSTATEDDA
jgi:uncharacterized protein (TIGR02611 family)